MNHYFLPTVVFSKIYLIQNKHQRREHTKIYNNYRIKQQKRTCGWMNHIWKSFEEHNIDSKAHRKLLCLIFYSVFDQHENLLREETIVGYWASYCRPIPVVFFDKQVCFHMMHNNPQDLPATSIKTIMRSNTDWDGPLDLLHHKFLNDYHNNETILPPFITEKKEPLSFELIP